MGFTLWTLIFLSWPLFAHCDLGGTEICTTGDDPIFQHYPVCISRGKSKTSLEGDYHHIEISHDWTHASPCFKGYGAEAPICAFTDETFAGGRGISIITTPKRANYLASTQAFTAPDLVHGINPASDQPTTSKYEMRLVPGKGMGLIATSRIRRGDLIMANTASLMIDYRAFNELSVSQYTTLQEFAVTHLPPRHAAALLALSPHTTNTSHFTRAQLIDAIAATNGFDIDPTDNDPDQHHSFFVLFPDIARMNHDCRPNADYRYEPHRLAQHVRAVRDINPGEEITLTYIDPLGLRAARTGRLKNTWGFECACPLCSLGSATTGNGPEDAVGKARSAASDQRIERIIELRQKLQRVWKRDDDHDDDDNGLEDDNDTGGSDPSKTTSPAMAELLVTLYETERLWGGLHEAYILAALEYSGAGDAWTAIKYASLGLEWGIPMLGAADEDVVDLKKLAENPWGHWSWKRTVGKEGKRK
ncbi:uncharacterized protein C8A04DRAFT_28649 [Dichotomopilus funicola]|uniref:SET domain-containing protein n=1 Tax=Dichotomopilus funicola TaxID=1934379 RepID=A0AAN6V2J4_9PEZI|nr:hypothetical protein C8A04DRAFT_28649 [Dichotomopilus funicola]